jgi:hypothetical protein
MNKAQSEAADESSQSGYLLAGGIVLIAGGIVLIMQAHAGVADFGGAMLALIGLALAAASIWMQAQRP